MHAPTCISSHVSACKVCTCVSAHAYMHGCTHVSTHVAKSTRLHICQDLTRSNIDMVYTVMAYVVMAKNALLHILPGPDSNSIRRARLCSTSVVSGTTLRHRHAHPPVCIFSELAPCRTALAGAMVHPARFRGTLQCFMFW